MKKFLSIIITTMLILACLTFTACIPNDADKAVAKLKEDGYTVSVTEIRLAGIDCEITANYSDSESGTSESIKIYYCDNVDVAKNLKDRFEKELAEDSQDVVGREGKVVYQGSKGAVKAIK
jgi:hypothetical protein